MATKSLGGGSSAVAASAHAACARFRGTDPLVTGMTRRRLAIAVGTLDIAGGIPEARWMRAMTFERLVRDRRFASEVATTAVGRLGLDRPTEVIIVNAQVSAERTAELLAAAHAEAILNRAATLIHGLAVPFAGFEDVRATDVKPDFAIVGPKPAADGSGSWLVMGDAKDYERMRSRIEDSRLLKGFLQVAVGAESCAAWSLLPDGMEVHQWGALAVPRNAFLQPEALVEDLSDHRTEVRMRVEERRHEAEAIPFEPEASPLEEFVAHLEATFDPASCTTCTLFSYCRTELRGSGNPSDLLIELGISADQRRHLAGLLSGGRAAPAAPASVVAQIEATLTGHGHDTTQRRIDPAGLPGTVNIVIAKSDAAALGIHGIAVQRVAEEGPEAWIVQTYGDPQGPATRLALMELLGAELQAALWEMERDRPPAPAPVHLVVPDTASADVLVSIADNLAGIELSRLRWERDVMMDRDPLTFDGAPARIPAPLTELARLAVSFLLEEDRARVLKVRVPIVDVRAALARHLIPGGPAVNALRLDYLVAWSRPEMHVDHRVLSDAIEASENTPGARLANATSDEIHAALTGGRGARGWNRPADRPRYEALVLAELAYKQEVLEQALAALGRVPDSTLRVAFRAIEGDAQAVWRRRLAMHASDLVRFGRTYRWWRNSQVPSIESDAACHERLLALINPRRADDQATSAGNRQLAHATVHSTDPLVLEIDSRRIGDGDRIVLLHVDGEPCVEADEIAVDTSKKTNIKIDGMAVGRLSRDGLPPPAPARQLLWAPSLDPVLRVGQHVVIAEFEWFSDHAKDQYVYIARPELDEQSAPTTKCLESSFTEDPDKHRFCCRPHEWAEAEFSDLLAERRERGELNPRTWPPIRDTDAFEVEVEVEVEATGAPIGDATAEAPQPVPDDVTIDDLE